MVNLNNRNNENNEFRDWWRQWQRISLVIRGVGGLIDCRGRESLKSTRPGHVPSVTEVRRAKCTLNGDVNLEAPPRWLGFRSRRVR